jgi:hypothetical protein
MTATDSSDEEYVCGVCGEAFETEAELERHIHEVGLVD